MNDIIAPVRKIKTKFALFQDLPDSEVKALLKTATQKEFAAKQVLIEQDTGSDAAYFVLEGSVNVFRMNENGEEISICILGEGDIVGEMALIDDKSRSAFVAAITDIKALVLSKEAFKGLLKRYPNIAIHLLSSLSKRLRESDERIENILTQNLLSRTWKTLQILKKYFPDNTINLSHEELSAIIGATRARTTEALDTLKKEGKITLSHRSIKLKV